MSLTRSGFKRPQLQRPPRAPLVPVERRGVYRPVSQEVVAVPKDKRELAPGDEARLWAHVRTLPCAHCWREGCTEVSHSNQLADGKGRGFKSKPWRVAALCHFCHVLIDSGKTLSKKERQEAWDAAHRLTIGWLFERGMVRPT
jgi:hypothetical protein